MKKFMLDTTPYAVSVIGLNMQFRSKNTIYPESHVKNIVKRPTRKLAEVLQRPITAWAIRATSLGFAWVLNLAMMVAEAKKVLQKKSWTTMEMTMILEGVKSLVESSFSNKYIASADYIIII